MNSSEKQILRAKIREKLRHFTRRAEASSVIAQKLRESASWKAARVIYAFFPLASEPDWRAEPPGEKKVFALPRVSGREMDFFVSAVLERGSLGAMEPQGGEAAPPPDLILVPGVAFDLRRGRMGRGGGYYDRWLARQGNVPSIGICFDLQIVTEVVCEPHDIRVDRIITEAREI